VKFPLSLLNTGMKKPQQSQVKKPPKPKQWLQGLWGSKDFMINQAFEEYYQNLYGSRWAKLCERLLAQAVTIPFSDGLVKPYMMDRASVLAALSLRLPSVSGLILDACAAPGGKSLVLASRMSGETKLIANELSSERRRRLVNVLNEYLDEEKRSQVTVSGFNAAEQGGKKREWKRFDAILLDAPCSSERHVIQSEKALVEWTPARPRSLARRQWSLLSAAFLLLKEGGSLVYSTCALSPDENDGPVARLLDKYSGEIELDVPDFPEGEKTKYGKLILPDEVYGNSSSTDSTADSTDSAAGGGSGDNSEANSAADSGSDSGGYMGPMYVARFRKLT